MGAIVNQGIVAAALAACAAAAAAQPPDADAVRRFVERETAGQPGRVEVSVGAPARRADFSACRRIEPFLPRGARLWGRVLVGARCVEGPSLSTYFPVQVRVYGPALVAARALAAGTAVAQADARAQEIELTREPPGALADLGTLAKKVLSRPLAAGQVLRAEHFQALLAVSAGDSVKLVYAGAGYRVTADGRAISAAADGQAVRVQTTNGRTLSGTARSGGIVQLGQ
jgi:flagella basal body P-ring formation protein FlgA